MMKNEYDSIIAAYSRKLPEIKNNFSSYLLTFFELIWIRFRENTSRNRILWCCLYMLGLMMDKFGKELYAAKLFATGQRSASQNYRIIFGRAAIKKINFLISNQLSVSDNLNFTVRESIKENRIRVIKPFIGPNEKGVIHVMFSEVISALPKHVNLNVLNNYFRLVLEPSWTGLCDSKILQYASTSCKNIIMAPDLEDFQFIKSLKSQLVPISLGPCDWVDPRVAELALGSPKDFDIVMNASWASWKRHQVLFSAIRQMKNKPRVALIGTSWDGGELERISRLANFYKVAGHITIFERVSFQTVMEIVCRSKCCLLLSLKEGANRALAESIFCDVPVILLDEHIGGIRKNIVPQTGLIVPEHSLAKNLEQIISGKFMFSPRKWGLKNISCLTSTIFLNSNLQLISKEEGEAWTQDIVIRCNSPESKYFDPADEEALVESNNAVVAFIKNKAFLPVPS